MKSIERNIYLKRLKDREQNGLVKIITGIRRSGKSYLLNNLFYEYLKEKGILDSHIIKISLDDDENEELRLPKALSLPDQPHLHRLPLLHERCSLGRLQC